MLQISEYDLTSSNTLGLASQAQALVRYDSLSQLSELSDAVGFYEQALVLGGGSNLVLGPRPAHLVIKVETRGIQLWGETSSDLIVEAQAGEPWHDFVAVCTENGWFGLENLALIPGTVGAAPVQNIGAYGVELDQRFHSLVVWDLLERRLVEMTADDCRFSYRDSFFRRAAPGRWLIVKVRFRLPKRWEPALAYPDLQRHPVIIQAAQDVTAPQVFAAVCEIRRSKLPDPALLGNAGSFFKNPVVDRACFDGLKDAYPNLVAYSMPDGSFKLAAGWLIDQAGWKGRRLGKVGVHDRQALVLVNDGGAEYEDIGLLADAVRTDVASKFGVELEQEPIDVR